MQQQHVREAIEPHLRSRPRQDHRRASTSIETRVAQFVAMAALLVSISACGGGLDGADESAFASDDRVAASEEARMTDTERAARSSITLPAEVLADAAAVDVDWGDGRTTSRVIAGAVASGLTLSHIYAEPGAYHWTARITTDHGSDVDDASDFVTYESGTIVVK